MSQRKMGAILSYLHIILSNSIALIYTPYMLRMLGQNEYGLYGTANAFISYLSVLSFGIGGAYIRFNARCRAQKNDEEEKRLNGMFLIIFSVLSVLVFIGGIVLIILAEKLVKNTFTAEELFKLRVLMGIMTANMIITFIFNVVTMALQAYEKFIFIRSLLLISVIITPFVNVFLLSKGGKSISISMATLIISFIVYIGYTIYAWKTIKFRIVFSGFDINVMKELFAFSSFLFLNTLTDTITFSTDNMLISSIKGSAAVAIYTVGANFKGYFQNFSVSISSVFAPQVNYIVANNRDKKELDDLFIKIGRIQFYIVSLILIGYIAIGSQFIAIWAGPGYEDSFIIGLLLILAVFVPAFQNIGIEIQKAKNMHKARSIVYFLIAIINVLMTIPLTKQFGGIGAALSTTICMFVGTVVFMNYYYWKYVRLDIIRFWKEIRSILPGYILPILVSWGLSCKMTLKSYVEILIAAIVITIVFICSVWNISMNQHEKDLLLQVFKKLKREG